MRPTLLLAAVAASVDPAAATAAHSGPAEAAAALAGRVLGPKTAKLFTFANVIDAAAECGGGPSCCAISTGARAGTVHIVGTSPVEMAYCLAHYCRTALYMNFAWQKNGGFQVSAVSSSRLPPVGAPIRLRKRCAAGQPHCYTYYMNVCTETYSAWNWGWDRWEKEVDWMALNGINLVLAYTGREYVYRKVYAQLGLNASSVELGHGGIEAGPAFLAFSRTENWANYDHTTPTGPGHPNWGLPDSGGRTGGPLPDSFVHDQWLMQKQIVARQTSLGIGSVLPAFQGNVPRALHEHFPSANISYQVAGESSAGVGWLDGLDPLFARISGMIMDTLIADFGQTHFYEADGFFDHSSAPWLAAGGSAPEQVGIVPNTDGISARAAAVFGSMVQADKNAIWVYQGWPWKGLSATSCGKTFMQNFVAAVPKGRLVILDLDAEAFEVWRRSESFYGASFVWAAMNDFGGTNGLFGDITNVLSRVALATADAPSFAGVGISMEGIDQNAAYYTAVLDAVWAPSTPTGTTDEGDNATAAAVATGGNSSSCPNCCVPSCLCSCCCPVPVDPPGRNTTRWLIDWGHSRCGKALPEVTAAWGLLAKTVYRPGQPSGLHRKYCSAYAPAIYPPNSDMLKWDKLDTSNTDGPGMWTGFYPENSRTVPALLSQWRQDLRRAWELLTESAEECDTESARFDVADVGREYLQISVCSVAYTTLVKAYNASDEPAVAAAGAALVQSVLDIDQLLSSQPGFTLGEWLNLSRARGHSDAEKSLMEWNARAQVTSWTPYSLEDPVPAPCAVLIEQGKPCHGIDGYAQKQWGGLTREQHAVRLQMFVEQVQGAVRTGTKMNLTALAFRYQSFMVDWQNRQWNATALPATAVGSPVEISRQLLAKYHADTPPNSTSPLKSDDQHAPPPAVAFGTLHLLGQASYSYSSTGGNFTVHGSRFWYPAYSIATTRRTDGYVD
jgi:alpha-N-acetylglucosaminidase